MPVSPVRVGLSVVPATAELDHIRTLVRTADDFGLDVVGVQDHPYQSKFLDTWALIPTLLEDTTRVTMFTDVANLPLRPPAMMAKAAASLDVLSGGRFELGLGSGAFWDAIVAMGGPRLAPKDAVDALEEAIAILRACWSGERSVTFEGEHYVVRGFHPGPPPEHPIGIWLGAYGPRMQRIAGRLADGWVPSIPRFPVEELAAARARIDAAAERAGRDPASIVRIANVNGEIADGPVTGYLHGPPAHWIEELARLRDDYGFDGFVLWSEGDMIEQIGRFAAEVAPALRS
jgi:alkanesulfonate monooxygenase SsuD/methylene tetrahydromethanopterin reductase-like flavin-dependent oxidoreductase (luciferase family)